jgi:hypothetical protein
MLNSANTTRFFQAASLGQDITITPAGTTRFRISWPPAWPPRTFSGISGSAGDLFIPQGPPGKDTREIEGVSHVKVEQVVLLHAPQTGKASPEVLAQFIKKAEAAIVAAIPAARPALLPQGCGIIAGFRIPKTAPDSFKVTGIFPSREAARDQSALLNRLQDIVRGLEVPEGMVYDDYIEMQVLFGCWDFDWNNVR